MVGSECGEQYNLYEALSWPAAHLGSVAPVESLHQLVSQHLQLMKANPRDDVFPHHHAGNEGLAGQHGRLTDQYK